MDTPVFHLSSFLFLLSLLLLYGFLCKEVTPLSGPSPTPVDVAYVDHLSVSSPPFNPNRESLLLRVRVQPRSRAPASSSPALLLNLPC